MIKLIEANGFRCLNYIRCEINSFEILVGPNASGKSTFLDVIRFLGDIVSRGLEETIQMRSDHLNDLIWQKERGHFEIAIEMEIPEGLRAKLSQEHERCRYEISVGIDPDTHWNDDRGEKT